jgi:hypothetical protein
LIRAGLLMHSMETSAAGELYFILICFIIQSQGAIGSLIVIASKQILLTRGLSIRLNVMHSARTRHLQVACCMVRVAPPAVPTEHSQSAALLLTQVH